MFLSRLFSRKWILSTILVIIGIGVLVRLGIWQLDRLEERRNFNTRVSREVRESALEFTPDVTYLDLANMEYRTVKAVGEYDFANQVILRNQSWKDQYGVHLITPFRIRGIKQAVLVDRGWIPAADMDPEYWSKYDEDGEVSITGIIRRSQVKPDFGRISDPLVQPGERLTAWNLVNIDRIQSQIPYQLLPVYISLTADDDQSLPHIVETMPSLTEGPHLSYAIQWFTFGIILTIIYVLYVRKEEKKISSVTQSELQKLTDGSPVNAQNINSNNGG